MTIKLYQDNIREEDKKLALMVRNSIQGGSYVIGNPALGLRKTLRQLEEEKESTKKLGTDWNIVNSDLENRIYLTKAGIEGEIELTDYLAKLIKYEDDLFGLIAFASLAYGETDNNLDYIPDTDTILVYGRNLLIIDAKKLKTKPKDILIQDENTVYNEKGKELISFNSSVGFWKKVFKEREIELDSIKAFVCIVNNSEVEVVKDDVWRKSDTKVIHISELKSLLKYWVKDKEPNMYLDILTEIAKAQIKEEKDNSKLDLDLIKRKFNV